MYANDATRRKKLSDFLKQVNNEKIRFAMFKGVDAGIYYISIDLSDEEIEQNAMKMEFPRKVHGLSAKVPFKPEWKEKVAPFRPKDIQSIIVDKVESTFDLHNLTELGILK